MRPYLEVLLDIPLYQTFVYRNSTESPALPGQRVEIYFGTRKTTGFVVTDHDTVPKSSGLEEKDFGKIKTIRRTIDKEILFDRNTISLAYWMADYYLCSPGEALGAMIPSGRRETETSQLPGSEDFYSARDKSLSTEQQEALEYINSNPGKTTYLFGITGSGKTEVFLRATEENISRGKGVIYLVPEISLTHQVSVDIKKRFGDKAAILHSALTPSQRLGEWLRIKRGEALIVIGARSAVFAPVRNLGLIIIDEEHDQSYKSGNTPRYNARQVAQKRKVLEGCSIVMGSATPSCEAWYQCRKGEIKEFRLTKRLSGGAPPEIKCVSLEGVEGPLSPELIRAVKEAKSQGRQSILFLNRRGFSHFFKCRSCGKTLTCKNCSASMTYHKSRKRMICHYCGWSIKPPGACPSCGSLDVNYAGFGTEFIEEEIQKNFPGYTYRRIDTDSVQTKDSLALAIKEFKEGKIDILLGTQMVAKGLNFPGVQVVGVISADTGLMLPDFRASERTFSLIVQVSGRAGRYFPDGKVIVQTFMPSQPAIDCACRGEKAIEEFYTKETAVRAVMEFPPFTRLIRFVFRSKKQEAALNASEEAKYIISDLLKDTCPGEQNMQPAGLQEENPPSPPYEILGPAECPLAVLSGNYRYQLLLKGREMKTIHKAARRFIREFKAPQNVYIETDVDPASLL